MHEPQAPDGPRRGLADNDQESARATDPLTRDEPASGGSGVPVELEAVVEQRPAPHETLPKERGELREAFDVYDDDLPVGWETRYDADDEGPDYDEEPEFEAGYDEESAFGAGEGPGPGPRLAPGPKRRPGPLHEHDSGPHKAPGKKAPGKKAPGKKAPGPKKHPGHRPGPPHEHGRGPEKAPGPKKHPGHRPGPPHEHGRECDPGGAEPEPGFEFGPSGGWGLGPRPGFGFGPGGVRDRRRGRPGDVRAAILALLAERPMHGYEMIQEIAERSQDLWRLSPGSVYPTLQLLDDEGLIAGTQTDGSKKLFELTDQGRAAAQKIKTPPWEKIAEGADTGQVDLRTALAQLVGAVTQSAYGVAAEHQRRIVAILKKARREIYSLLAEAE